MMVLRAVISQNQFQQDLIDRLKDSSGDYLAISPSFKLILIGCILAKVVDEDIGF